MIADVRHHLEARPFEPFSIITSSGNRYRVATADHADINPIGNRTVVWFDDGGSVTVAGLHIVYIEKETTPKNGTA